MVGSSERWTLSYCPFSRLIEKQGGNRYGRGTLCFLLVSPESQSFIESRAMRGFQYLRVRIADWRESARAQAGLKFYLSSLPCFPNLFTSESTECAVLFTPLHVPPTPINSFQLLVLSSAAMRSSGQSNSRRLRLMAHDNFLALPLLSEVRTQEVSYANQRGPEVLFADSITGALAFLLVRRSQ